MVGPSHVIPSPFAQDSQRQGPGSLHENRLVQSSSARRAACSTARGARRQNRRSAHRKFDITGSGIERLRNP